MRIRMRIIGIHDKMLMTCHIVWTPAGTTDRHTVDAGTVKAVCHLDGSSMHHSVGTCNVVNKLYDYQRWHL